MKADIAPTEQSVEPLWGMKDVMRYLGFGYTRTWNLIHQYGLPCYQIGGGTSPLRFDPNEVQSWVKQYKDVLKPRNAVN